VGVEEDTEVVWRPRVKVSMHRRQPVGLGPGVSVQLPQQRVDLVVLVCNRLPLLQLRRLDQDLAAERLVWLLDLSRRTRTRQSAVDFVTQFRLGMLRLALPVFTARLGLS
jgi:hypothetical protein